MFPLGRYIKTQLKGRIAQIGKRLGEMDISSILSEIIESAADMDVRYSAITGGLVMVYKTPGGEVEIELDDDDDDDDDDDEEDYRYDDDDDDYIDDW